ncbi:MAG: putative nucleotidyltransferase substrate binding domain-containing protein [Pseudomonadota bacterium]
MEIEQLEIRDYLSRCAPLDKLDEETLNQVAAELEIGYARRGKQILKPGDINRSLYLIRSGAVEIRTEDDSLHDQLGEESWFGFRSLFRGGDVVLSATALEDTLLYQLPIETFHALIDGHESVRLYFSKQNPIRMRNAIQELQDKQSNTLIATHVSDLTHGTPQMIEQTATIEAAAQKMKSATVTAMLVMDQGRLCGILTDRAFCTKVTANRMSFDDPVSSIMTPDPLTIPTSTLGAEALLVMARHNIRHLPVMDGNSIIGMITATDLIRQQSYNTIYLINEIHRADTVEELQQLSRQLPGTMATLVDSSLTAYDIGHAISSIGEAITRRLVRMAEEQFGEAPIPYAWITAGSMARNEQTAHSDQDNALILSNNYDSQQHGDYFEKMSHLVCDGLNACGYVYCPGDVMATNPKWRQPLSAWRGYFNRWIFNPQPKALMYASIFFDLQCVHGDTSLLETLQSEVLKKTQGNTIFLAYMTANALHYHPPLGLFKQFVLEKGGAEEKALNMKKRGIVPITDLARVYALSAGVSALNTQDRLEAAGEAGVLSRSGMADLVDALEFIASVRLQHQSHQIRAGEQPDNFVPPEQLSSLERRHLKDAFDVVRTIQTTMETGNQTGNF